MEKFENVRLPLLNCFFSYVRDLKEECFEDFLEIALENLFDLLSHDSQTVVEASMFILAGFYKFLFTSLIKEETFSKVLNKIT